MMVTKRVSPAKKPTRRKATTAVPELTDGAAMSILEPQSLTAVSARIDPNFRRQLVAAEAYFLAERRGFTAGNELEDWVAAEVAVDSRLQQMQAA